MSDFVVSNLHDGVLTISLYRPEKRNALNLPLILALADSVEAAHESVDSGQARCVILSGEGPAFCAGMDLHGVVSDPEAMSEMLHTLAHVSLRIRALHAPTIARVQGAAIGGGCGLMVIADFAITHPEAKLGYPEVDLGLCPAVVAPWLIRKIGPGRARSMLLAGGTIGGEEALARGLVDRLVPLEHLDAAVGAFARTFAAGGREATRTTKRWLNELDGGLDAATADRAAALSARVIAGDEAQSRLRGLFGDE